MSVEGKMAVLQIIKIDIFEDYVDRHYPCLYLNVEHFQLPLIVLAREYLNAWESK